MRILFALKVHQEGCEQSQNTNRPRMVMANDSRLGERGSNRRFATQFLLHRQLLEWIDHSGGGEGRMNGRGKISVERKQSR